MLSSSSLVSKSSIDIIWVSSSSRKRERCALIELDATRQAEFVRSELRGRREYADAVLARIRALIHEAEPAAVETWKWRGVPVWERGGILCTGETYKDYVKTTFFRGAALDPMPPGASKQKNVRYLDIREDDEFDEAQFADWVKQASQLPGEKM